MALAALPANGVIATQTTGRLTAGDFAVLQSGKHLYYLVPPLTAAQVKLNLRYHRKVQPGVAPGYHETNGSVYYYQLGGKAIPSLAQYNALLDQLWAKQDASYKSFQTGVAVAALAVAGGAVYSAYGATSTAPIINATTSNAVLDGTANLGGASLTDTAITSGLTGAPVVDTSFLTAASAPVASDAALVGAGTVATTATNVGITSALVNAGTNAATAIGGTAITTAEGLVTAKVATSVTDALTPAKPTPQATPQAAPSMLASLLPYAGLLGLIYEIAK